MTETRNSFKGSKTEAKIDRVRSYSLHNQEILAALFGFSKGREFARDFFISKVSDDRLVPDIVPAKIVNRLSDEVSQISNKCTVSINISWESLKKVLHTGRFLSIWDVTQTLSERNSTYYKYHYQTRRDEAERKLGIRATGEADDPHPIYGAIYCPNGRDEYVGGAGAGYGECFVLLNRDRVISRTLFTYSDSFDEFCDFPLLWSEAIKAKAMLNLCNHENRAGYIEAQILGGVTVADIQEVIVPARFINQTNKFGFALAGDVLSEVSIIKSKYPFIPIRIK